MPRIWRREAPMAWSRASSRSRSMTSTRKVVMMPKTATTTATPSRA